MKDPSKLTIAEQTQFLEKIIHSDKTSVETAKNLVALKLKPEVISEFITKQSHSISPELLQILEDKRIQEEMSPPKISRALIFYAKKDEGAHSGRLVKKIPLNTDDKAKQKYDNIWLEKNNYSSDTSRACWESALISLKLVASNLVLWYKLGAKPKDISHVKTNSQPSNETFSKHSRRPG